MQDCDDCLDFAWMEWKRLMMEYSLDRPYFECEKCHRVWWADKEEEKELIEWMKQN